MITVKCTEKDCPHNKDGACTKDEILIDYFDGNMVCQSSGEGE